MELRATRARETAASTMFFLLRLAFWIGLVLVLLPTGKTTKSDTPQVDATEAVTAATAAMSDFSQFCARQPTACEISGQAATAIGHRAQAGARKVYEFIAEKADKSEKADTKPDTAPEPKTETKAEIKPEKIDTKAAAKPEAKAEKKPARAVKKNPDHTGSIEEHGALDADGMPTFDNTAAHEHHAPDWSISGVETIAPLLP